MALLNINTHTQDPSYQRQIICKQNSLPTWTISWVCCPQEYAKPNNWNTWWEPHITTLNMQLYMITQTMFCDQDNTTVDSPLNKIDLCSEANSYRTMRQAVTASNRRYDSLGHGVIQLQTFPSIYNKM